MNELDKKLDEVLQGWVIGGDSVYNYPPTKNQALAAIKQAFIDDGWLRSIDISLPTGTPYVPEPRMTGQEWYDRFLNEMVAIPLEDFSGSYVDVGQRLREAAKKAAGLD